MAVAVASSPPKEPKTLTATIPLDVTGVPIKGILSEPGKPARVLYFTPATLARVLGQVKAEEADLTTWWDLLGATGFAAKRSGTRESIVMTSPPGVRDIRHGAYQGEKQGDLKGYKPYKVHLPALVWILHFTGGKLTSGNLFCSERLLNSLDEDAKCSVFPYGHANEQSGLICWGSAAISHVTPKDPRLAERMFFGSGTNHHLYAASWLGPDLGTWLKAHQGPEDLKMPIPMQWGRPRTIRQLLAGND